MSVYVEQSLESAREQIERGYNPVLGPLHLVIPDYVLHGYQPGSFLTALLSNDFMEAVGRADEDNARCLKGRAQFFYNYVPNGCFRSPEHVATWLKNGGLVGRLSKQEAA